jgi:hypothetical protein
MKHAASALLATLAPAGTARARRQFAVTGAKPVEICSGKERTACDAHVDGAARPRGDRLHAPGPG